MPREKRVEESRVYCSWCQAQYLVRLECDCLQRTLHYHNGGQNLLNISDKQYRENKSIIGVSFEKMPGQNFQKARGHNPLSRRAWSSGMAAQMRWSI